MICVCHFTALFLEAGKGALKARLLDLEQEGQHEGEEAECGIGIDHPLDPEERQQQAGLNERFI